MFYLLETNISPYQGTFDDDFLLPQGGYVSFLEGNGLDIALVVEEFQGLVCIFRWLLLTIVSCEEKFGFL